MTITRTDSRNRVGIVWFDNEAEADKYAARMLITEHPDVIAAANVGFAQCGRDRGFDVKDASGVVVEFAVVTP